MAHLPESAARTGRRWALRRPGSSACRVPINYKLFRATTPRVASTSAAGLARLSDASEFLFLLRLPLSFSPPTFFFSFFFFSSNPLVLRVLVRRLVPPPEQFCAAFSPIVNLAIDNQASTPVFFFCPPFFSRQFTIKKKVRAPGFFFLLPQFLHTVFPCRSLDNFFFFPWPRLASPRIFAQLSSEWSVTCLPPLFPLPACRGPEAARALNKSSADSTYATLSEPFFAFPSLFSLPHRRPSSSQRGNITPAFPNSLHTFTLTLGTQCMRMPSTESVLLNRGLVHL